MKRSQKPSHPNLSPLDLELLKQAVVLLNRQRELRLAAQALGVPGSFRGSHLDRLVVRLVASRTS